MQAEEVWTTGVQEVVSGLSNLVVVRLCVSRSDRRVRWLPQSTRLLLVACTIALIAIRSTTIKKRFGDIEIPLLEGRTTPTSAARNEPR